MRPKALLVCAGILLLGFPVSTRAQVFHDDFDGTALDPSKWNRAGGGTVSVSAGFLNLSAADGMQFPYLTPSTNPFPTTGDFFVRVGMRYSYVGIGGNGLGFDYNQLLVCLWQDACYSPNNPLGCGGLRACVGDGTAYYVTDRNTQDTRYHIFEWVYHGGLYRLSVDGVEVAQDASPSRPDRFFLGHPPYAYFDWTSQQIDFVHIEYGTPTPTLYRSWGQLKTHYR